MRQKKRMIQKKKDGTRKKDDARKKEESDFKEYVINIDGLDRDGYNINGID